jgi:hypothetical protein
MGMPPAGGGAPWRPFCGTGRCLPLVSEQGAFDALCPPTALRWWGWYVTQTEAASALCAQAWKNHVHDCLQCPEAVDRGVTNRPQVSDPAWRRRPQSLWATVLRPHVMAGQVIRAANGATFTLGVAADRRLSAPPPQPFLVVCCVLLCSVSCPRGCSNSLMLRRCGII